VDVLAPGDFLQRKMESSEIHCPNLPAAGRKPEASPQARRNRRLLSVHVAVLLGVCVMPLVGLALYFLSTGLHREIAIAEQRRAGLVHVQKSVGILQKAVRLAWSENGDDVEMMRGLEEALAEMEGMELPGNMGNAPVVPDGQGGRNMDAAALWQNVKDSDAGSQDRAVALRKLTQQLHHSIFEVSDVSGLSSGSENEISALTDVVSVCMPGHVDHLMHMHESLGRDLKAMGWDDATRKAAAIFVRQLEHEDIQRLDRSVEAALKADLRSAKRSHAFQSTFPAQAASLLGGLQRLADALRPFDNGQPITLRPEEFDEVLRAAFENAVTGWDASIHQLDVLISEQIGEAVSRRNDAIWITGMVMVALLPLAWGYFRFCIRPVMQAMVDEAARYQKEAEEAWLEADESTRRLRQTQAALYGHSAVLSIDLEHRIFMANEKSCELAGCSKLEMERQFYRPTQSPTEDDGDFSLSLWAHLEQGRVWHGNMCRHTRDGGLIWVNATIFPFIDREGRPVEFVAIETDITELVTARERAEAGVDQSRGERGEIHGEGACGDLSDFGFQ